MLYDEPTTGLDPINVQRIVDLILHLQRQLRITSIVVTHDMHSALTISDNISMIHNGEIIFNGTPKELLHADDSRVRDFVHGNPDEEEPGISV